jgi:hypothetical protein
MISEKVLLTGAEAPSFTVTVTLKGLPTLVAGVPLITPVVGFIDSVPGSPVADQV